LASVPLRWGVLGGSSRIYRDALLPVFEASPLHEVVAEASRRGDDESPYDDLLARPDVDAVYIPLPNHLHAPWITRALHAGKHVLCEKPLTMSVADTEAVFAAASASGQHLVEAYMWPHHPRSRRMLELVAAGDIGVPQSTRAVFCFPLDDPTDHRADLRGDGALFDLGIYCIGPALMMAGRDPAGVRAVAVRNPLGVDVVMSGLIDWGDGFASTFDVSFDAPLYITLEVAGTHGVITLPAYSPAGIDGPSQIVIRRRDGSVDRIDVAGPNGYRGMVDQFAAVVAGTEAPVFGREESCRLARVEEALRASSGITR
jgi:D-xylose 1-dehydrogenase (NADP+, D-xylono-1,5-lactone-forming)